MTVDISTMVSSSDAVPPVSSGGASVHSSSEESLHPSVVSDLLDGDLCDDELNEIPTLPIMGAGGLDSYHFESNAPMGASFLDESHPATHIAFTASAIDGALAEFEFFLPISNQVTAAAVAAVSPTVMPKEVPILPAAIKTSPAEEQTALSSGAQAKKRGSATKTSDRAPKKRRVSKEKADNKSEKKDAPPACVSPSSSLAGDVDRKMTVSPTLDGAVARLPSLPDCPESYGKQPLLPKPTTTTTRAGAETPPGTPESAGSAYSAPPSPASSAKALVVSFSSPVNISSEHIQMLVSETGPAECAKVVIAAPAIEGRQRSNKQNMSQEERAKASRDRNREHARNTRLRKKAYVEELKRTLMALADQRDRYMTEQQEKVQREAEQRNVRYRVLEEFLNLRGSNFRDASRWAAILVPGFTFQLPVITEDNNGATFVEEKNLVGVDQVMHDSDAWSSLLQSLGGSAAGHVGLQYNIERSDFFMDGENAVLYWKATTVGAMAKGAKDELKFHGNVKAKFDPNSNKLVSVSMIFDSGVVLSQKHRFASNY